MIDATVKKVSEYWNSHPLGTQYIKDPSIEIGSPQFFEHIRPWMNPYKFPDVLPRIEKEAALLHGKHMLEVGCGMGFDTVEFLKRGVRVTATDLTPVAVELTKRHLEVRCLRAEDVRVENVLSLSFPDNCFDAVYSIGVIHHTGDTPRAVREIYRVLKPGGRAIICHLYRRRSWFRLLSKFGAENIEFKDEDAPVIDFFNEDEVVYMFRDFEILEMAQDHYRALPIARTGFKAALYSHVFRPVYNLLPEVLARQFAHKLSVIAVRPRNS